MTLFQCRIGKIRRYIQQKRLLSSPPSALFRILTKYFDSLFTGFIAFFIPLIRLDGYFEVPAIRKLFSNRTFSRIDGYCTGAGSSSLQLARYRCHLNFAAPAADRPTADMLLIATTCFVLLTQIFQKYLTTTTPPHRKHSAQQRAALNDIILSLQTAKHIGRCAHTRTTYKE